MKKIISITLIAVLLLSGCAQSSGTESSTSTAKSDLAEQPTQSSGSSAQSQSSSEISVVSDEEVSFNSLGDPMLLQYVEDTVYSGLANEFQSEDYVIENVKAIYLSKEYLEETSYNTQANIWFGYSLEELDQQFEGERYVFSLGEDQETIVTLFEDYDDTYEKVLRNVLIGTGVIMVCVTVSVITGGMGAVPISMVFAASAKTGTIMALSSGGISAAFAATVTGIQTGDMKQAMKAAALKGSESFKWGAITGAIAGGISEASALRNAAKVADEAAVYADNIPQWRQAEMRALSKYGGKEQVSYLNGAEVEFGTPGATRPDVVREVGKHLEAIEVKYYNLESSASLSTLHRELEREVAARVANLPADATQRIVLDVTGRSFSKEVIEEVTQSIQENLFNIYPNIPIDIVGL